MKEKLVILLIIILVFIFIIASVAIIAYIYNEIDFIKFYYKTIKQSGVPLFTYQELKPFLLLGHITRNDEHSFIFTFCPKDKRIAVRTYIDYLKLCKLQKTIEAQKFELIRQKEKAEILQDMQRVVNSHFEEIENNVLTKNDF